LSELIPNLLLVSTSLLYVVRVSRSHRIRVSSLYDVLHATVVLKFSTLHQRGQELALLLIVTDWTYSYLMQNLSAFAIETCVGLGGGSDCANVGSGVATTGKQIIRAKYDLRTCAKHP